MIKTNAIRILDKNKIKYEELSYETSSFNNGLEVSNKLGLDSKYVFKTIVLKSKSNKYYTVVINVEDQIDLKKCAAFLKEKSLELINQNDLEKLTGYVRGGCSPIGMKKQFRTILDDKIKALDYIYISAGKIGFQVKLNPNDLEKVIKVEYSDIVGEIND